MEAVMSKQRQKVGKAAFLQAVTKSKSGMVRTPPEPPEAIGAPQRSPSAPNCSISKPQRPFSLKEISDDAQSVEHKWLEQDGSAPFVETRRTPDIESMDMDQYQQSVAQLNSSLQDIQTDIQRLSSQQNQIQATQQQSQLLVQQQQMAALVNQHHMASFNQNHEMLQGNAVHPILANANLYKSHGNLHNTPQSLLSQHQMMHYGSQHNVNMQTQLNQQNYSQLHQNYGSNPHINAYSQPLNIITSPKLNQDPQQFYLHEQPSAQRRTWAQQAQPATLDSRTYNKSPAQSSGFMLHEAGERFQPERYQNGDHSLNNHTNYTPQIYNMQSSPQHKNTTVHRQISQIIGDGDAKPKSPVNLQRLESAEKSRSPSAMHIPLASPPVDDMAPQSISFIGNEEDEILSQGIGKLNITSGSRTYRIPSPTRPSLNRNSFHQPLENPPSEGNSMEQAETNEKGFYISFDNEQPKRPKPPLRVKRGSPRKERGISYIESTSERDEYANSNANDVKRDKISQLEYELAKEREKQQQEARETVYDRIQNEPLLSPAPITRDMRDRRRESSSERESEAIIIGNDLTNPDPESVDEMERKKEKIMLLSLQRRQQQEADKARKELESMQRRDREKQKDDDKARKKEEQAQRRAAILEQYKLKKAIEEAEREGKVLDKSELMSAHKPTPKMRPKGTTTGRPRLKTIHVDSGSVEMAEGMLTPSRGKKRDPLQI